MNAISTGGDFVCIKCKLVFDLDGPYTLKIIMFTSKNKQNKKPKALLLSFRFFSSLFPHIPFRLENIKKSNTTNIVHASINLASSWLCSSFCSIIEFWFLLARNGLLQVCLNLSYQCKLKSQDLWDDHQS